MSVIRVAILGDQRLLDESLATHLDLEPDISVVARWELGVDALREIQDKGAQLLLLARRVGRRSHLDVLKALQEAGFTGARVVLADDVGADEAFLLACLGVTGVISTDCPLELLTKCVRKVVEGEMWFDQPQFQGILRKCVDLANGDGQAHLSPREQQVLRGLLDGLTNKEIAAINATTESAVKSTMQQLFHKTGVRSRSQLVRYVIENREFKLASGT